ncbi:MAG: alcohol dehydrogenase catalytic domain-containing protein [Microbacterium sp.]
MRVTRAAICGTDLGLLRTEGALPHGTRIGHEFTGVVESIGSQVSSVKPGMRVFGCDYIACGHCWWCRSGDHWHCPERRFFGTGEAFGPALDGAQADLVRVPFADTVLAPVPDTIDDDRAVFLGDLIPTGWAAVHRAQMRPGDTVVVSGGGPVGQIASLVAQACGAGPVVMSEPDSSRRDLAARCGAHAVEPTAARPAVDALTEGRGADVVIDCVGGGTGLAAAVALVRARGSISSVGVPHADEWSAPVKDLFTRQISLSFVVGDAIRDRQQYLPLVSSGLLDPSVVVSRTVDIRQAVAGYEAAAELAEVKVLLSL